MTNGIDKRRDFAHHMNGQRLSAGLAAALFVGLSAWLPAQPAQAICKSRLSEAESQHYLSVRWRAPEQYADNKTELDPATDVWGYKIWRVDKNDPSKRIEVLASADRHDSYCRVFVPAEGDYTIAMVSIAHEDSALSQPLSYTAQPITWR